MMSFLQFDEFFESEFIDTDFQLFENYDQAMERLQNAITNKFICTLYYKGDKASGVQDGYRQIEPYALGVNRSGNTILRAWMISGASKTGRKNPKLVPGWRIFRVDRIFGINQTLQKFTSPRKGYNAKDKGMTEVMYSVTF